MRCDRQFAQRCRLLQNVIALIDLQGFQRGGATAGSAGKGTACSRAGVITENFIPRGNAGAGLYSAGKILSGHQDIGHHVIVFHRPHLACPTQPGKHFVGNH